MEFNQYIIDDRKAFSRLYFPELERTNDNDLFDNDEIIYYLGKLPLKESRGSFCVSHASDLDRITEDISLMKEPSDSLILPDSMLDKITKRQIMFINTSYPQWRLRLSDCPPEKWTVNLLALGDVGSTLLIGLKLLGGDVIDSIGIYDRNESNLKRWEVETNQICHPFNNNLPPVKIVPHEDLFDCDMFVFCASKGVPSLGSEIRDVRMAQFDENAKIIAAYAKMARHKGFKGVFSVVSDPVDQLCYTVFKESNTDENGNWDYKGLSPERIKGYGLGVMHARAVYFSKKNISLSHYENEGRAFGPHGEDLVIADSIIRYNQENSLALTNMAVSANLEVRSLGYKPYIAPALSSGALSIIKTITGDWHYSANFLGGAYMGSNNRHHKSGIEIEKIKMSNQLESRIRKTYEKLRDFNEKQN
ncbi:MAG: lactate dehydrogenase [Eubacteriales bacterium]|nr:lactate dehydrogenase [Eubacteriales bacterium]